MAKNYPSKIEFEQFALLREPITNNAKFFVTYSPLGSSKSRVRAWRTLVALEEKGYIFGFYINKYGRLHSLKHGIDEAKKWNYWKTLSTLNSDQYDEIDSGDVIVYFTPKGLQANTKNTSFTDHEISRYDSFVELLKNDKKLKRSDTKSKIVDKMVKLVYEYSETNAILGIINQSQFVEKEENLNYDLIKESLKKELKEKRGY